MDAYLSTRGLCVGYEDTALLYDISLSVRRGEILTLIGPNGAGKSTILKTLSRQLAPMGGAVYLDGTSVWEMGESALARKMALVTTERIDPERMTCRDVVSMGRYPYTGRLGILGREDKAVTEQALARVHALDLAGTPFARVSDGQRQRVMLARAICQRPEVILLDEPTSFLDIRHKLELLGILRELVREEGLAIILSLHELDLAQKISDTVVCVQSGQPLRMGPPEEIFTDETICALYGVSPGSYSALFGSAELAPEKGAPRWFVIGGGGSGVPLYRKLCREGVPFAAGILPENDLDYPVAKALSAVLVSEKAYEPVADATMRRALDVLARCEKAVCTLPAFGAWQEANRRLWQAAQESGKKIPLQSAFVYRG